MTKRKSIFERARAAVSKVVKKAEEFLEPAPAPKATVRRSKKAPAAKKKTTPKVKAKKAPAAKKKTTPKVKVKKAPAAKKKTTPKVKAKKAPATTKLAQTRRDNAAELTELEQLLAEGAFYDVNTRATAFLKRFPNNKRAKVLLQEAKKHDFDGFGDVEKEYESLSQADRFEALENVRKKNILKVLASEGVEPEILETLYNVEDWTRHFVAEIFHNGQISDPKPGSVAGDRVDTFAGSLEKTATQMAFWASMGTIYSITLTPMDREVTNWRPLYDDDTVHVEGGGTFQGKGKRKPTSARRGRPKKRRGRYTDAEWEKVRKANWAREDRARKSSAKTEKILFEQGPKAALRHKKGVAARRRAAATKAKNKREAAREAKKKAKK